MIRIINEQELVENASFNKDKIARKIALKILKVVLNSLDPREAIKNHVRKDCNRLLINNLDFNLDKFQNIYVIGGGKASGSMAEALEEILSHRITKGFINILQKTKPHFKTRRIKLNEAGHPIPDKHGLVGTKEIIQIANKAKKNDLMICLISGGGSALLFYPASGITLQDTQKLTKVLLESGSTIQETNIVRKHISQIKGGWLAKAIYPATLVSLILSDVVDDSIDTIASGPTAPDNTTFNDAKAILRKYELWDNCIPQSVKKRLDAGSRGVLSETPKPNDRIFEKTHNFIIGSNRLASLNALNEAKNLGFNSILLSSMIEGEARHVGTVYAGILKEILLSKNPIPNPAVVISGGESTVKVTGLGKGGRNQELVQSASMRINGFEGIAIASINTDGIDGPTTAAGAIIDGNTIKRAQDKNLSCEEFLRNNDSFNFFSNLNDLIFTGPTDTNVGDLTVMVVV